MLSEYMSIQDASTDAETLLTMAGRNCYRSFHRPNEATYDDADYLRRTLGDQGHWSIAEHATATLYFTGVSRAFLAELTRHRHLSFSVESQRFINANNANIVIPPAIECGAEIVSLENVAETALREYEVIVNSLTDEHNLPRKQAREAARALLPNAVETRMVVTANLRAWHEVIHRRTQPDADAEMQEVMRLAAKELHTVSPIIFPQEN